MSGLTVKNTLYTCCPRALHPYWDRVEASPIGYRLARGAFWSLAGGVISRGSMLVALIVVARMLGKEAFGEFGIVRATVGMFGILAGFGLGLTATKHVAEFCRSDPARAGRIVALSGLIAMGTGGLMALALFAVAPWLAAHTLNAPHLSGLLRIGSLLMLLNVLNGAQTGALAGFEAFKTIARVNLLVGFASFPILVVAVCFAGFSGAVWGLTLNAALNWTLNHLGLRREAARFAVPLTFAECTCEWKVLWYFSLPAFLSGAMVGPVNWVCNSILANQHGGYGHLGMYAAILSISLLVRSMNGLLGQVFLPVCVSELDKEDHKFDFTNIILPWGIGLLFAVPLICLPEVVGLVYGGGFSGQEMNRMVVLVMLSTIIVAHRQGIARNIAAKDRLWWSMLANTLWGGVAILGTYLMRDSGGQGMAAAFAIAYGLNTIIFIPFYIAKGLCPKELLASRYTAAAWTCIAISGLLTFLQASLWHRSSALLVASLVIIWSLVRLSKQFSRRETNRLS